MADHSELKRLAEALIAANDLFNECLQDNEVGDAWSLANDHFTEAASPEAVLAIIAENTALKGPHDWLAEDLIKELVDNAQAFQENSGHGENDPFAIALLAAASRIRRQEANLDQLKAENEALRKNAERYQWLREARSGYIEVVEWIGPHATGMTGEDLDALLDAAMGKGEQS